MKILLRGGFILTFDEENRVLEDGALVIEDQQIQALGQNADFEDRDFDQVLNLKDQVILPGLINAHMHCYSSFATGLTKAAPAQDFVGVLKNLWWRLDRALTLDDCYHSAMVACIQAIRFGTTTFIDHHASPMAVAGSLDAVARAVTETGLRASLCYEVSDRDGQAIAAAGLAENARFIQRAREETLLHGLFGLHASFTLGDATLNRAADMARELETGLHIHVAEARADRLSTLEKHGLSVVRRLERAGVLGPETICAHAVHVDKIERQILAETLTMVTHQPQSNMNNAVGVMDLFAMADAGVLVGLGTDAMTSNMLEELRSALWLRKLSSGDPSAGFVQTTDLLKNNAKIANRFFHGGLGSLVPQNKADIVSFQYVPHTPLNSQNQAGHLVYGLSQSRVSTTIVDGRILMAEGVLTQINEQDVLKQARARGAALWERF